MEVPHADPALVAQAIGPWQKHDATASDAGLGRGSPRLRPAGRPRPTPHPRRHLTAALLRPSPPARRFFLAYLQSSLGNGMGYVALVLVALERFHSPWAVAAILIADLVPLMAARPP